MTDDDLIGAELLKTMIQRKEVTEFVLQATVQLLEPQSVPQTAPELAAALAVAQQVRVWRGLG